MLGACFVLLWDPLSYGLWTEGEDCAALGQRRTFQALFCVSCREGLVAMHEFTEQPRAAAIVMSVQSCHVTAWSSGGCPGARKASASRTALGVLVAGGSCTEEFSGNSLCPEKGVFFFSCRCESRQTRLGILLFPLRL